MTIKTKAIGYWRPAFLRRASTFNALGSPFSTATRHAMADLMALMSSMLRSRPVFGCLPVISASLILPSSQLP